MWDIFVSYSSEERESVVLPLVRHLQNAGIDVWFDQEEIHIGESIRERIDHGLANSVYGIVILSESYFEKVWTKRELDGLLSIEEFDKVSIIPVWHQIDKTRVAAHTPLLANRLAIETSDGIRQAASEIIQEVLSFTTASGVSWSNGHAITRGLPLAR